MQSGSFPLRTYTNKNLKKNHLVKRLMHAGKPTKVKLGSQPRSLCIVLSGILNKQYNVS